MSLQMYAYVFSTLTACSRSFCTTSCTIALYIFTNGSNLVPLLSASSSLRFRLCRAASVSIVSFARNFASSSSKTSVVLVLVLLDPFVSACGNRMSTTTVETTAELSVHSENCFVYVLFARFLSEGTSRIRPRPRLLLRCECVGRVGQASSSDSLRSLDQFLAGLAGRALILMEEELVLFCGVRTCGRVHAHGRQRCQRRMPFLQRSLITRRRQAKQQNEHTDGLGSR